MPPGLDWDDLALSHSLSPALGAGTSGTGVPAGPLNFVGLGIVGLVVGDLDPVDHDVVDLPGLLAFGEGVGDLSLLIVRVIAGQLSYLLVIGESEAAETVPHGALGTRFHILLFVLILLPEDTIDY